MESLESRAIYAKVTKFLKIIRQEEFPELTPEELKEIDEQEKYFLEQIEFRQDLEKRSLGGDLAFKDISQSEYDERIKAQEDLHVYIKEMFNLFRLGVVIFDSLGYIRSCIYGFSSKRLLNDFKKMFYFAV